MIRTNISGFNFEAINNSLDRLSNLGVDVSNISNEIAEETKNNMINFATENYNISENELKKESMIKVNKASRKNGNAFIKVRGRPLTTIRFVTRASKNAPVQVEVKRGAKKTVKRMYVQTAKHALKHAFRRWGTGRYPTEFQRSISIPQMLGTSEAKKEFEKVVIKNFYKKINKYMEKI